MHMSTILISIRLRALKLWLVVCLVINIQLVKAVMKAIVLHLEAMKLQSSWSFASELSRMEYMQESWRRLATRCIGRTGQKKLAR